MKGFLDTNVLVYAFGDDDRRRDPAEALLQDGHVISVQVLNEFVSVALRKLRRSWVEIEEAAGLVRQSCSRVLPITLDLHDRALVLCQRYRLAIYDALIVPAALEAGCNTLYSEDLHAGLVIDDRLTIVNPFA